MPERHATLPHALRVARGWLRRELTVLVAYTHTATASVGDPPPTPQTMTITGSITNAVTGAVVGSFTQTGSALPAQVTVSAPGYITRSTSAQTATPRVDLFPENSFDLRFYRQLARDDMEDLSGIMYPLLVLRELRRSTWRSKARRAPAR